MIPNALAMALVFDDARIPGQYKAAALAMAAHAADEFGRGMFPSASTVGRMTGKSLRQAQRDIQWLERNHVIARGDQALASRYKRLGGAPVVYDLCAAEEAQRVTIGIPRQAFARLMSDAKEGNGIGRHDPVWETLNEHQLTELDQAIAEAA